MKRLLETLFSPDARRQWGYALAIAAALGVLAVLPAVTRLRKSLGDLRRIKTTYAMKLAWVSKKAELERRVREQEATFAKLDAMQLHDGDLAAFTQGLAVKARAVGCAARSIRPAEPRVLPRPEAKGNGAAAKAAKAKTPQVQFLEWPVQMMLQGEYSQLVGLLRRLGSDVHHVQLTRLEVRPDEESRERLNCNVELAGYGLRALPGGR